MEIRVEDLEKSFDGRQILNKISFAVEHKEFVGIIGPNGSGKSTLLKCIYRVLRPDAGTVFLGGDPLDKLSIRESARRQAVLAQHNAFSFEFTVVEVVLMGRSPHKRILERYNAEDYKTAKHYLTFIGMEDFAEHPFSSLSGGERQRVLLARALTQSTSCLILDEPTNHLDIRYQLEIMENIRQMDLTVIAAVHDLNIAASYCDRIIAMRDGVILKEGTPQEIFTDDFIYELYGVRARIHPLEDGNIVISYHL